MRMRQSVDKVVITVAVEVYPNERKDLRVNILHKRSLDAIGLQLLLGALVGHSYKWYGYITRPSLIPPKINQTTG